MESDWLDFQWDDGSAMFSLNDRIHNSVSIKFSVPPKTSAQQASLPALIANRVTCEDEHLLLKLGVANEIFSVPLDGILSPAQTLQIHRLRLSPEFRHTHTKCDNVSPHY